MPLLNPNRVAYVVKRYPRYSETFIVNEILAHEQAGLEIEIYSLRPPEDTHFQNAIARVRAPVNYIPSAGIKAIEFWSVMSQISRTLPRVWSTLDAARTEDFRDVYQALLLAQDAHQKGITHLHAHFGTVATTVARLAARTADIPYSFTAHAKDIFHESVCHQDLQRKLRDAAAVVTVSDFNARFLEDTYGQAADRVQRIYNGLSLEQFPYRAPADRPPRVVSVGRLVEKKGFVDLIQACAILTNRGRRFDCQIIGCGELEIELRHQIDALGLQDVVTLIGPRPQNKIIRLVQDAAIFAAPCVVGTDGNRDGLPTVLLEAMALGTPCVSTDVTGIPEVLRHEETGLMVNQHDPEALATAIERLLLQPDLGMRLADRARRLIEANFDVRQNAAGLRSNFRRMATGNPVLVQETCA